MTREIKFRATYEGREYDVQTKIPKRKNSLGIYITQGYVKRLVNEHPFADKRGYVGEHRLVIEQSLGRFLLPSEFIHHLDQNRQNNDLSNLRLFDGQANHAIEHLRGTRNPNGQFIASEPIFSDIKFRLLNTNSGLTEIWTLGTLIGTTFRRGQFKFRGRFTGLKDVNGLNIFEGDILLIADEYKERILDDGSGPVQPANHLAPVSFDALGGFGVDIQESGEVFNKRFWSFLEIVRETGQGVFTIIGNIWENPELLEAKR